MLKSIYNIPFLVLEVPNLKIKRPSWFQTPSPFVVFCFALLSYFLICGGIIYDIIVEPPSIGSTTDEHGNSRPVAFMPYRWVLSDLEEILQSTWLLYRLVFFIPFIESTVNTSWRDLLRHFFLQLVD